MNREDILMWVIYKITNPSNKIYIGKTMSFKTRIRHYEKLHCKAQKLLYNSFCTYGFENHTVDKIDEFESDSSYADNKEMFWIRSYMSNRNKYPEQSGLNLTDGGDGARNYKMSEENKDKIKERHRLGLMGTNKGMKHTEETKRKLSLAKNGVPNIKNRGKVITEEQRRAISEKLTGRTSPKKGKPAWTEDQKKAIGNFHKGNTYRRGKTLNSEQKKRVREAVVKATGRPIIQFDLLNNFIRQYDSVIEAHRVCGVARSGIQAVLSGAVKSPKRFIFKYK